ncbi:unnamed protein product [Ixodes pacificus]
MSRKGKIKGDLNMVECGECKRWCYLEETDFESVAEAEKGTFACRLCEKIEEGLKRLEREWKDKFEEMKEELKEEREKRVLLETQVTELKRGEPELKWQAELNEEREKRAELEKQVEELRQGEAWKAGLEEGKKECEDRVERVIGVIREEKGKNEEGQAMMAELQGILRVEVEKRVDLQAQWEEMKRESTAAVAPIVQGARKQGASSGGTREVPRTYSEAAQKEKETAGTVEPNLLPVVNGGSSNVVPGEKGQPSAGRRVLVVGDSNVARIVEGVLGKVKEDKRVRVEAQPGKYMVDAIAKAEELLWDNMEGENLVLIHAGLNDVLNGRSKNLGKQIEAGLGKLRAVSERVHVEICTIPRVRGQSLDIERRVIEANRVIKGLSRRLEYGIKEINWEVYADGSCPFTRGGIHYSPDTGRRVGERLGRHVAAFLGTHRARRAPV